MSDIQRIMENEEYLRVSFGFEKTDKYLHQKIDLAKFMLCKLNCSTNEVREIINLAEDIFTRQELKVGEANV